jgi:hypothetical protein
MPGLDLVKEADNNSLSALCNTIDNLKIKLLFQCDRLFYSLVGIFKLVWKTHKLL